MYNNNKIFGRNVQKKNRKFVFFFLRLIEPKVLCDKTLCLLEILIIISANGRAFKFSIINVHIYMLISRFSWMQSKWCNGNTNVRRCVFINCPFIDVPSARWRKWSICTSGHWITCKKIKRKTRWIGFVNYGNYNQRRISHKMCDHSTYIGWPIAGMWMW